jgi:hypothetical protein
VQLPRGPPEMQLLGDRDEVAQVPQLHRHSPPLPHAAAGPAHRPRARLPCAANLMIFRYTEIVDNISGTF